MSTPRLRARSCPVDAELARSALVELPEDDAVDRVRSIGDLLRSLLPVTVGSPTPEGPLTSSAREARVAD
jgi:hypothetical protein